MRRENCIVHLHLLFIQQALLGTYYVLYTTGYCWETKDENDLFPASSSLRKTHYTNKVQYKMLSIKVL